MSHRNRLLAGYAILVSALVAWTSAASDQEPDGGAVVQFGEMHEAIGQQRHEGRVDFSELVSRDHFYGVAAVEGLEGEATIIDSSVTLTRVDDRGRLQPSDKLAMSSKATMLVGGYVPSWTELAVNRDVPADRFDQYIADAASNAGVKLDEPFLFTVEGQFIDVRLHVINGACPIRARMKEEVLPEDMKPFKADLPRVRGTVVGVFALDSVGKLTHPATSVHCHLVYADPVSGKRVTGHIEKVGMHPGATLRVPRR